MNNLVSTQWLAAHLTDPNMVVLDATWHLPAAKRNAHDEFLSGHIAGAQFFDIDKTSDLGSTLPHTLPSASQFEAQMGALGISNSRRVVVYDTYGLFSAARCWWMFKIFGHGNVAVLDGGLKKWLADGRSVQTGEPDVPKPTQFSAVLNPLMVRTMDEVATSSAQIADARSPTRFRGEEAEPRRGVRAGHIPGARNVHYASVLAADGTLRPRPELLNLFTSAGLNVDQPIVTSCGSGVTAAILSLALTELGAEDHALYNGSWAEWGSSTRPIATGPAV